MAPSTRPFLKYAGLSLVAALTLTMGPMPLALGRIVSDAGYAAPEAAEICRIVAEAHNLPFRAHSEYYSALDELHAFAESTLRRPRGSEPLDDHAQAHYQQLLAPLNAAQRQHLVGLLHTLATQESTAAISGRYDYIFIHSSTVPGLRRGLAALSTSVLKKSFEVGPGTQVIFFDGERQPYAKETLEVLLNPSPYLPDPNFTPTSEEPADERQVAEFVYRQLWLPSALRAASVSYVRAPNDAEVAQVHTEDVVRHWLETAHPRGGRALMVSSQPYLESQRLATVLALRESHGPAIEVVAMEPEAECEHASATAALGPRLDNLAESLALALKLRTLADQEIQSALQP